MGHLPDERSGKPGHPAAQRPLDDRVAHIRQVIQVVRPVIDAVRNEQILVAVVVQIGEQGGPAPIGGMHAGQIADLAEANRSSHGAAVELERIAGVLRMIPGLELLDVHVEALGVGGGLEDLLLVGQHVEHDEVGASVVVDVGRVDAHGRMAGVSQGRGAGFGERAVALVDVEKVVFLKVVGDVQVGAAVPVEIARDHAQAVSGGASVKAGALTHVDKMAPIVSIEAVADPRPTGPVRDVRG